MSQTLKTQKPSNVPEPVRQTAMHTALTPGLDLRCPGRQQSRSSPQRPVRCGSHPLESAG